MYTLEQLQKKSLKELKEIGWELNVLPEGDRRYRESWINAIAGVNPPLLQLLEVPPAADDVQAQEPIESPPAALECPSCSAVHGLYTDNDYLDRPVIRCLHCSYCRIKNYLGPIRIEAQEPISQVAKTSPGVEVDLVHDPISRVAKTSPGVEVDQLPECSHCFDHGYFEDESGLIKSCVCSSEPRLSRQNAQRAIVPAAKISESDQNPILTGVSLSDRFLARYAPPQSETIHYEVTDGYNVDTDGQLSLFDVQVQSPPEPPDPDDFESLDAFRDAISRWDWEHPSTFDHCSDLPSSVHCEPSSVHCEEPPPDPDDFGSIDAFQEALARWDAENAEMLAASMDSMCEWAPCPDEWYEPEPESLPLKASSMMELSPPAIESSSTSDFFIPTFGAWCDRANRQTDTDEPPDTGIFARLPGPKPPKFPPRASQPKSAQVRRASRNYPETIPKQFSRVAAGSSTQPARSPPGGDAGF
ncbi:hypothetical protein [Microcoleus sp. herbarium2]|uniref:hypothetical protein n=1 Tax=Microcoleus sp. herbarium2 TaxID=3055433 RepID=UPI002FCE8CED